MALQLDLKSNERCWTVKKKRRRSPFSSSAAFHRSRSVRNSEWCVIKWSSFSRYRLIGLERPAIGFVRRLVASILSRVFSSKRRSMMADASLVRYSSRSIWWIYTQLWKCYPTAIAKKSNWKKTKQNKQNQHAQCKSTFCRPLVANKWGVASSVKKKITINSCPDGGGGRRPTDRGRDPERGRPDPPKGVGLCLSLSLSLSLSL